MILIEHMTQPGENAFIISRCQLCAEKYYKRNLPSIQDREIRKLNRPNSTARSHFPWKFL